MSDSALVRIQRAFPALTTVTYAMHVEGARLLEEAEARAIKAEEDLRICRIANNQLTARVADTEGTLREIDGWLNGDHISTYGDATRSWKEASAIARAALEASK